MTETTLRCSARVSAEPLDVGAHLAEVSSAASGALAVFVGQVRDHDPDVDGEVVALEYSAHPDAEAVLRRLAGRIAEKHDVAIAVSHRTGRLTVGEAALVVCVASTHRAAAFDAGHALVETLKAELPVWKRQITADGGSSWVGCP